MLLKLAFLQDGIEDVNTVDEPIVEILFHILIVRQSAGLVYEYPRRIVVRKQRFQVVCGMLRRKHWPCYDSLDRQT